MLRKLGISYKLLFLVLSFVISLVLLQLPYLSSRYTDIGRFFNKGNAAFHAGILGRSKKANPFSKRLHIVTQFPVIKNRSDAELILLRQKEYVETLQKNLAHPHVCIRLYSCMGHLFGSLILGCF